MTTNHSELQVAPRVRPLEIHGFTASDQLFAMLLLDERHLLDFRPAILTKWITSHTSTFGVSASSGSGSPHCSVFVFSRLSGSVRGGAVKARQGLAFHCTGKEWRLVEAWILSRMVPLFAVRTCCQDCFPSRLPWICVVAIRRSVRSWYRSAPITDLSYQQTVQGFGRTAKVSGHPASLYISS
jgi:hypothetical protein